MLIRGAVLLSLLVQPSFAQTVSPQEQKIFNNYAHDVSECLAYYMLAGACLKRENDPTNHETLSNYSKLEDHLKVRALQYTKLAGLKYETVGARVKLATDAMMKEIETNCGNMSLLIVKFSDLCKSIVERPEERLKVIFDRENARR